ncbi:MAG: hypothetical protein K2W96_11730 [Gemmataceae bacterium]|nr:hypothetical protein [Gemmataceae bacterium]
MFVRLASSDEEGKTYPAHVVIMNTKRWPPAELNAHFNYFRCLGYGATADPDENMSPRHQYPKSEYWMPEALDKNADKYAEGKTQDFMGVSCRELRREGWDEWLVEDGRPRRRVFRWSEGGPIREVIEFSDFRPTGKGIDLPWRIVHDMYAHPEDGPQFRGKVSRRLTLTVKELTTDPLPDSYFRPIVFGTFDATRSCC